MGLGLSWGWVRVMVGLSWGWGWVGDGLGMGGGWVLGLGWGSKQIQNPFAGLSAGRSTPIIIPSTVFLWVTHLDRVWQLNVGSDVGHFVKLK